MFQGKIWHERQGKIFWEMIILTLKLLPAFLSGIYLFYSLRYDFLNINIYLSQQQGCVLRLSISKTRVFLDGQRTGPTIFGFFQTDSIHMSWEVAEPITMCCRYAPTLSAVRISQTSGQSFIHILGISQNYGFLEIMKGKRCREESEPSFCVNLNYSGPSEATACFHCVTSSFACISPLIIGCIVFAVLNLLIQAVRNDRAFRYGPEQTQ